MPVFPRAELASFARTELITSTVNKTREQAVVKYAFVRSKQPVTFWIKLALRSQQAEHTIAWSRDTGWQARSHSVKRMASQRCLPSGVLPRRAQTGSGDLVAGKWLGETRPGYERHTRTSWWFSCRYQESRKRAGGLTGRQNQRPYLGCSPVGRRQISHLPQHKQAAFPVADTPASSTIALQAGIHASTFKNAHTVASVGQVKYSSGREVLSIFH